MAKSPFSYTATVDNELFIGREDILSSFIKHIKYTQNVIIYGNRRVGKSSLVQEAINRYQKKSKKSKHLFIQLEFSQFSSKEEFITHLSYEIDQLIKKTRPLKSKFEEVTNFISALRFATRFNSITGEAEHLLDFTGTPRQVPTTVNELFDLLESIAQDHKLTIVFDEFQTIVDWDNNGKFQWLLRSRIQKQKNIGYIFLGSSRKLIHQIFLQSTSAFYKSGILIHIENHIKQDIFFKWIKQRFKKAKININNQAVKRILEITKSHPYYTQKLCYNLWAEHKGNKTIDINRINEIIKTIIEREATYFEEKLASLTSNQRQVVKAIGKLSSNEKLYSKSTIRKYALPSKTSIKTAIKTLENSIDPVIYKRDDNNYIIEDPFFNLWLSY